MKQVLEDFIPIGCGRTLTPGVPEGQIKGKAVEMHHYLFDGLWNLGSKQIDAAILLKSNVGSKDEEEKKEDG